MDDLCRQGTRLASRLRSVIRQGRATNLEWTVPSIFSHPDTRVMTYNLKNGGDIRHWEERKSTLVETILRQNPTILGTQEGFEYQLAYIRDELQHYEMLGDGRDPFIGGEYCAVFVDTRVSIVEDTGTFWLSQTPDVPGSKMPEEQLPRIATWVRLKVHGTPLLYVNTHLTHIKEGIPAQMSVLVRELKKLIDPAIETVITGDFNIDRNREPMASLRALGFKDVWSVAESTQGPRFTFPGWDLWDDDRTASVLDENRIDWVCIRPAGGEMIPPISVETVHTHRMAPVPSDHFPVVVSSAK